LKYCRRRVFHRTARDHRDDVSRPKAAKAHLRQGRTVARRPKNPDTFARACVVFPSPSPRRPAWLPAIPARWPVKDREARRPPKPARFLQSLPEMAPSPRAPPLTTLFHKMFDMFDVDLAQLANRRDRLIANVAALPAGDKQVFGRSPCPMGRARHDESCLRTCRFPPISTATWAQCRRRFSCRSGGLASCRPARPPTGNILQPRPANRDAGPFSRRRRHGATRRRPQTRPFRSIIRSLGRGCSPMPARASAFVNRRDRPPRQDRRRRPPHGPRR